MEGFGDQNPFWELFLVVYMQYTRFLHKMLKFRIQSEWNDVADVQSE